MKVGDTVLIKKYGECYTTYYTKFEEMGFNNPTQYHHASDMNVNKKTIFTIFAKSRHGVEDDKMLYAIEDSKGNQLLFSGKGLKRIKKGKKDKPTSLKVKIKRLSSNSVIPSYSKDGDAGMDITATSRVYDGDGNVVYGTGLAFEVPKGYVGLLFPRSSNAKQDLILSNSVGVVDSGYRGEVLFKFKPSNIVYTSRKGSPEETELEQGINKITPPYIVDFAHYNVGDRIGQIIIIPIPQVQFEEVEELSETERGEGGYGSSGK